MSLPTDRPYRKFQKPLADQPRMENIEKRCDLFTLLFRPAVVRERRTGVKGKMGVVFEEKKKSCRSLTSDQQPLSSVKILLKRWT